MRNINKLCIFVLCMMALSSCLPDGKHVLTSTPSPSVMLESTLQSFATPLSIRNYLGQVSDSKLLFSIEEVKNNCYNAGSVIEIKLEFRNLTANALNIVNNFTIASNRHGAGGNVIPFLFTEGKADIYSLADARIADFFPAPVNDFITIPVDQEYTLVVNYRFPKYFIESLTSEAETILTPSPGSYFLRFIYSEYQRDIDTWYGFIGSNLEEICIAP